MFGSKSRAEKLKEQAEKEAKAHLPLASIAAAAAGARPILERLLYDDDLRKNVQDLVESLQDITHEVQGENPRDVLARLWDDEKLRGSLESASVAAQSGGKRLRGESLSEPGGKGRKLFFLIVIGGLAYLFFSPKTGPEARRLVKETVEAISSN
ncbi:MAG: YtxH domain-containing protein [Rubrobacter sp.]